MRYHNLRERSCFNHRSQIPMRGGDNPHIHMDRALTTDPLHLMILQHPQEMHLGR